MRKAVFNGFIKIILVCVLICSLLFTYIFTQYMRVQIKNDLEYSLVFIDYTIDFEQNIKEQIENINELIPDKHTRITIIRKDGTVLADTGAEIDLQDNHLNRTEVKEALYGNIGSAIRYSDTLHKELFYVAAKSSKGNFIIRLSVPYNGLKVFLIALIPAMLLAALIAFVVAFCYANRLSKTITEPLEEISNELIKIQSDEGELIYLRRYEYEELNNVCETAEVLSRRVSKNLERLRREKNKISYILDNMSEGIILIDGEKQVATINKSAIKILDSPVTETNKNILFYTQQLKIIDGVARAIENDTPSFFDISKNGKIYAVHITKVNEGFMKNTGAIVLLIDVTNERENQRIRQEFFSNASHELKTPLTSIIGYSELLVTDMTQDKEKQKEFISRIRLEAENMAGLINDILMISRLEAGMEVEEKAKILVKPMVEEIINTFEPDIMAGNIKVTVHCQDITIDGVYSRYYQLINNLVSNAVKYNRNDGEISIDCVREGGVLQIQVANTGTSIPPQYQKRVFERFFRVDKGRSKRVKGTGLGLAIVRHIVEAEGGNITLKSGGDMTEFTVIIPFAK